MNEAEKERLIKKDIASIENRVRHAFNQGYEMGLKESRSEIPNTCGDAISRQAVLDLMRGLTRWCVRSEDGKFNNVGLLYDDVMFGIDRLPSVTPQQRTGRWSRKTKVEDVYDIAGVKTWGIKCQCDRCDFSTTVIEDFGYYKWCPNCGAKMEVEE